MSRVENNFDNKAAEQDWVDVVIDRTAKTVTVEWRGNIQNGAAPGSPPHLARRHPSRRAARRRGQCGDFHQQHVNTFTPYGHPDLLRQALVAAMVAHLGNLDQMAWLLDLLTVNPARMLGLADYGLAARCQADLVVLDAADPVQAITEQVEKLWVIKAGQVVACNTRSSVLDLPWQGEH